MFRAVKQAEDIPITDDDIRKLTNFEVSIVMYHELANVRNILDIFKESNRVILFYELMGDVGHWVCLIKDIEKRRIIFYNSYGLPPDGEINLFKHKEAYLSRALGLTPSPWGIDINPFQHQRFKNHVNTCGRHSAVRAIYWRMSNAEYDKFISDEVRVQHPDEKTTMLTMLPLQYTIKK